MILLLVTLFCLQRPPATAADDRIVREIRQFKGTMGLYARNLLTGEEIAVDADRRFPTASTIKTAVLLEAYAQIAAGRLRMDQQVPLRASDKVAGSGVLRGLQDGLPLTLGDLLHLMIVLSDNTATNMVISLVGTRNVDDRLVSLGFRETKLFRPTFRDGRADLLPELEKEFGLGMTTPREMAALLALIAEGRAVSADASSAMLQTLRAQQDRGMIPRLLPDTLEIGNKTGSDEEKHAAADGLKHHVRADAAIVTGKGVKYVIAIYARDVLDTRWTVDNDALTTGARISRMVFDRFSR